jgi:serine/threonine protein kinase
MFSLISRTSLTQALAKHGYTPIGTLGKGGYGEVYLAYHEQSKQQYAVKITQSSGRTCEVDALKSIWHPHVVYLYDTFLEDDLLFLVFEYCPGGSLSKFAQGKPLPRRVLLAICPQVIAALKACHAQKLAHLDIKPGNILIDKYGRAKLTDFGISQISRNGVSWQFQGTLAFTAPEILHRLPYDPFKADVWSLGVTFYRLATGEFPGSLPFRMIQSGLLHAGLPGKIAALFIQMMEPCPGKRIKLEDINLELFETRAATAGVCKRPKQVGRPARRGQLQGAPFGCHSRDNYRASDVFFQPTFSSSESE